MNNIVHRLRSRKFWLAIGSYLSSILIAFNISEDVIARVTIIVSGIGALIVYILAEAAVDKKRAEADAITAIAEILEYSHTEDDEHGS